MPSRTFYRLISGVLLLLPYSLQASNTYDQITHGDQMVSIHYQASLSEAERRTAVQWLEQVTTAILTIYGELPNNHMHINIDRSANRSSPVPWGQVERGNPTRILLVINPALGTDALISDWTAFHELSHLLIPYEGYGNVWLSEGLATYYQNIVQARSGLFNDTRMWGKIASGLERGRKDQRWRHIDLTEVSDNLRETRQYMRVHWSGVLFWLTADVELRKQGKGTLDDALKQLKYCCEGRSMSARAIVHKLDALTNMELFVPLFQKYRETYAIPEYQQILADLGVKQRPWTGGISLDDDAPLAEIRRQIVRGEWGDPS
jgi:hypothetical protein